MKTITKTLIAIGIVLVLFLNCEFDTNKTSNLEQPIESQRVEESYDSTSSEVANQEDGSKKVETTKKYYNPNQTIIIRGLGNMDNSDLEYASSLVTEFYGYNCVIMDNVTVPESIYMREGVIDAHEAMVEFSNINTRTIFLTPENLYVNDMELRGYTTTYGNAVVINYDKDYLRETLIHELGHTLGLLHCDDLTCIMAINNDAYDSGDFCDNCKNKLNK